MQLQGVYLKDNQLVGSLPEAWSNLTHISPFIDLTGCSLSVVNATQGLLVAQTAELKSSMHRFRVLGF